MSSRFALSFKNDFGWRLSIAYIETMKAKTKLSLGQKIKKLRRERNLSQTQLAEKAGTTLVSISNYETGKTKPSSDMLINVAKALGVSADYLMNDSSDAITAVSIKDKELLRQFEQIDRMADNEKKYVKYLLQSLIDKEKFKELAKEAV
jgi:transcriptional regulator with XRE-family HTH domain